MGMNDNSELLSGSETVCPVCFRHCELRPGQWGFCGARRNEGGRSVPGNYGQLTSLALDPIEKKPLHRFFPGSSILSVGSYGCNLRCPFCQNHEISMAGREAAEKDTRYVPPEILVQLALRYREQGNIGAAFTYNEPGIGWEYVLDTSKLLRERGMKSVMVTNGTLSRETLERLLPWVDAMNIDLKGFREEYYRMLGGCLQPVKEFISAACARCHVELTTLIVPGENDSVAEMEEEAEWIASLDPEIPLHVSRFFPKYRMTDRPATETETVYRLAEAARRHLRHVYTGNC